MKILIDTNVLIDFFARREPFFEDAEKIFELCQKDFAEGVIASHSIVNMAYILRKKFTLDELKKIFSRLCIIFKVESLDREKILRAIEDKDFKDFEDCLQLQCAINFDADYIVTRNVADFKSSKIPAITPQDFLKLYSEKEVF